MPCCINLLCFDECVCVCSWHDAESAAVSLDLVTRSCWSLNGFNRRPWRLNACWKCLGPKVLCWRVALTDVWNVVCHWLLQAATVLTGSQRSLAPRWYRWFFFCLEEISFKHCVSSFKSIGPESRSWECRPCGCAVLKKGKSIARETTAIIPAALEEAAAPSLWQCPCRDRRQQQVYTWSARTYVFAKQSKAWGKMDNQY